MTDYRTIYKNVLANAVAFLVLANIFWVIHFFNFSVIEHYFWFLMVPFGALYVIRLWTKSVLVFALLHIVVVLGAVFIIGHLANWVEVLVFMGLAVLYSYYVRGRGERELSRTTGICLLCLHVFLFIFLGQITADTESLLSLLLLNFIVIVSFIIVYIHIENVDCRSIVLRSMSSYDHNADKVLAFNNKMVILFAVFFVGVGFLGAIFPVGMILVSGARWVLRPILGFIQSGIDAIINFLMFLFRDTDVDIPEITNLRLDEGDGIGDMPYLPDVQPEIFRGLIYALAMVSLAFILLLIIYLIVTFFRRFYEKSEGTKAISATDDTVRALPRNILGDLRALLPRLKLRSRNGVRRAYARKVNGHIKGGVYIRGADTTNVISNKIRPLEDIDELTAMYEVVRYGPRK